jgi:imidazolonepropionase-like amidohydrolase
MRRAVARDSGYGTRGSGFGAGAYEADVAQPGGTAAQGVGWPSWPCSNTGGDARATSLVGTSGDGPWPIAVRPYIARYALLYLLLLGLFGTLPSAWAQKIAVEADKLSTEGPAGTLTPGVILMENGKITAVGPASAVTIPAGYERLHAKVATPGLIDAKTSVGLSGWYNSRADQDQDESTDPNTADVRALDSFNPREPLLEYIRNLGVTTVQTGPGPDNPIAGQAGIFKTAGPHGVMEADAMAVRAYSAMVFNLGEDPKDVYGSKGKPPSTRMGTAEIIRKALLDAQIYSRKWADWERSGKKDPTKRPTHDLKLEALARVVEGKVPAIFTAEREDDISTALRIAREFKLKPILAQAAEGYLARDVIRRAGVPVIVEPTTQRLDAIQTENATLENAALLADVGIPIAFSSGFEGYVPKNHVLLFEAAIAAANGLGWDRTLQAATLGAARILGIADRVGSLEPGKDADVVLFDGDPFEYTSHVEAVLVNGEVTYRRK